METGGVVRLWRKNQQVFLMGSTRKRRSKTGIEDEAKEEWDCQQQETKKAKGSKSEKRRF